MTRLVCWMVWGAIWIVATVADAHKPSDSYLTLVAAPSSRIVTGQWDIALRDLHHVLGLDSNADGLITWGELKAHRALIERYASSRLRVEAFARGDRADCAIGNRNLQFDDHVDGGYAVLRMELDCPLQPAKLIVHYSLLFDADPNHRGLLNIRAGERDQALVLAPGRETATIELDASSHVAQFFSFVREGVWHIWKGFDHILFLLTLLLPAVLLGSSRDALLDVLKVVTAFTVAHSITLSLAVNGAVDLPSRIVESAIALTVLLGALNNLFPVVRKRRWAVAFVFGLVHGLGFASVLADLGLQGWNLARALVGFNIGVEAGQLAIVVLALPVMFGLRGTLFYRRVFVPVGALSIACIALYWIAERAFDLKLA